MKLGKKSLSWIIFLRVFVTNRKELMRHWRFNYRWLDDPDAIEAKDDERNSVCFRAYRGSSWLAINEKRNSESVYTRSESLFFASGVSGKRCDSRKSKKEEKKVKKKCKFVLLEKYRLSLRGPIVSCARNEDDFYFRRGWQISSAPLNRPHEKYAITPAPESREIDEKPRRGKKKTNHRARENRRVGSSSSNDDDATRNSPAAVIRSLLAFVSRGGIFSNSLLLMHVPSRLPTRAKCAITTKHSESPLIHLRSIVPSAHRELSS